MILEWVFGAWGEATSMMIWQNHIMQGGGGRFIPSYGLALCAGYYFWLSKHLDQGSPGKS